ncbi:plasmid replication initiator RepA [Franconibacter daqui]|uniref:plasmid replication initiator RepA n=1 Tax=Franconibacter daqui TaxID=2047724 RepID=UPI002DB7C086|nr:plasmid replication initiator RepA [Franconibacter daqui]MEB5924772.1 replication initiator protein RepA [Franconibacter daqui]
MNDNLTPRADRRHRGNHSTVCKCPDPVYLRPAHYKPLCGEHGRALRNLMQHDRKTGNWQVRRRVSADIRFVILRQACGRKRALRPEMRRLIDALFVVFVNAADLATDIITLNISKLAEALSPRDENGNIIPEKAVTVSRVSRAIQLLCLFGVIDAPTTEWDLMNGCRFPKHVMLTEAGWQLTGINMDRLRAEQEARRQAIRDGILQPGENLSLKAARSRWYENCRNRTILSRRTRALEGKQRRRLEELPFDERKRQVAERLYRSLGERAGMFSPQQFEKLVWQQLYQLKLVNLDVPAAAPPLH